MSNVLLIGYRLLDFEPEDKPGTRVRGFTLFLAAAPAPDSDIVGFVPVNDGGKRFLNELACSKLGITDEFLHDNLFQPLQMEVDINGKIISCSALP